MQKSRRIFLDTRVIFAAVLSEAGGARLLFKLGEAGILFLLAGPNVLRECETVVRRKSPASLPLLAHLLELGKIEITAPAPLELVEQAKTIVAYPPDAYVLAEAMGVSPDWFVTHDKTHFLKLDAGVQLQFRIGTPGDFLEVLQDEFRRT